MAVKIAVKVKRKTAENVGRPLRCDGFHREKRTKNTRKSPFYLGKPMVLPQKASFYRGNGSFTWQIMVSPGKTHGFTPRKPGIFLGTRGFSGVFRSWSCFFLMKLGVQALQREPTKWVIKTPKLLHGSFALDVGEKMPPGCHSLGGCFRVVLRVK